jgi:hypothetical protein
MHVALPLVIICTLKEAHIRLKIFFLSIEIRRRYLLGDPRHCSTQQPGLRRRRNSLHVSWRPNSLYVFGDVQSRLFLGQPKEANKALIAMQQETNDPQFEPITRLDMLYYQADVHIQQGELEPGSTILSEAALLAKDLGSRLYFNKLAMSYHQLQMQWSKEPAISTLEDVFQMW